MAKLTDRGYRITEGGGLVVDVPTLFRSERVKRDIAVLRQKIEAADAKRAEAARARERRADDGSDPF